MPQRALSSPPPCPADFNLAAYVLAAAKVTPDATALEIIGHDTVERWSYREIEQAATQFAVRLRDGGLGSGDRILLRLSNRVEFPLAFLGALMADCVPVPTSSQLTSLEITALTKQVNPELIVSEPGIACPDPPPCPVIGFTADKNCAETQGFTAVLGQPDRLGYIVFTSGMSGTPKGVCHAHRAIWARRMMWRDWYDLRPEDRVLHAGAFNWTYTLGTGLLDPWSVGATALVTQPSVVPEDLPALIASHKVTIFAGAPGIYRKIANTDTTITSPHLRHGLSAGEKLAPNIAQRWHDLSGCAVHEALGMSEISTFVSGSPSRPAPPGTTGFAQTGRRIAVLDDTGAELPNGSAGELAVHRSDPGLMVSYLNQAPLTDEWFRTGDIVCQDHNGAVSYLGRVDDMLNAGGFRVSPIEVEAAFSSFDAIKDCGAASVEIKPDTFVIALFYQATDQLDPSTLRTHAQDKLARYKQPRLYIHCPDLPKGGNGKMNRKALPALYKA
ncbi:MAG: class I adenylate-forming enzyme family protein [Pseudomonadota bacterium]